MTLHAFNTDGDEVHIGDTVVDFRGDTATLAYLSRPQIPGKSGKVVVTTTEPYNGSNGREYYDKVFNLTVVDIP